MKRSGFWRVIVFSLLIHPARAEMVFISTQPLTFDTLFSSPTEQALTLVDPELTQSVAPPPPESLPEPPPQFRLPDVIADSRQWRGLRCGVTLPRYAIFRHGDKWNTFWEKGMTPYVPHRLHNVPEVDFTKEMVIGVFLGERRDPHYAVEIRSITPQTRPQGPVLVIRYRKIRLMEGVFSPAFPVQPFHLRKLPRFDGEVIFEPVKR
ncbi:MAG: hypothetical protein WC859_04790 [Elusimicrobiota bacterium]|jgi:hypothetical protein